MIIIIIIIIIIASIVFVITIIKSRMKLTVAYYYQNCYYYQLSLIKQFWKSILSIIIHSAIRKSILLITIIGEYDTRFLSVGLAGRVPDWTHRHVGHDPPAQPHLEAEGPDHRQLHPRGRRSLHREEGRLEPGGGRLAGAAPGAGWQQQSASQQTHLVLQAQAAGDWVRQAEETIRRQSQVRVTMNILPIGSKNWLSNEITLR